MSQVLSSGSQYRGKKFITTGIMTDPDIFRRIPVINGIPPRNEKFYTRFMVSYAVARIIESHKSAQKSHSSNYKKTCQCFPLTLKDASGYCYAKRKWCLSETKAPSG